MSFREHAAHVPLVAWCPARYAPRRVKEPVSLADVLPTLADVARPGLSRNLVGPVDGRSVVPLLEGEPESPDMTVAGEYLAEGVERPMVMLRRDRWKFIHTPTDHDQLFDLDADPLELVNRAGQEDELVRAFRDEVRSRWDLEAIDRDVRASQQARLTVFRALQLGAPYPWDFQPSRPASAQYTRNTMDVAARDEQSRFPPLQVE
jgi:choline-sulfatase